MASMIRSQYHAGTWNQLWLLSIKDGLLWSIVAYDFEWLGLSDDDLLLLRGCIPVQACRRAANLENTLRK